MELRNLFMTLLLCAVVGVFAVACVTEGDQGPPGPQGEQGPQGEPGMGPSGPEMGNPDNCTLFADRSRILRGSNRADIMCGNDRNNTIKGGDGDDTIFGREGNDSLYGEKDDDFLYGNEGNDKLRGGEGDDEVLGGPGDDELYGGEGKDVLDGGEGTDVAIYLEATITIVDDQKFLYVDLAEGLSEVKDVSGKSATISKIEREKEGEILEDLIDIENIWGSAQPDVLLGDSGDNVIGGDDGGDYLDGRSGTDTVSYMGAEEAVTVDLAAEKGMQPTNNKDNHAAGDTLIGFENILGTAGGDTLKGDENDNIIWGMDGDDTLEGGAGNDTLEGGIGDDTLEGGAGNDTFVFTKGDNGSQGDTVTDFATGDKILLKGFNAEERKSIEDFSQVINNGDDAEVKLNTSTILITLSGFSSFRPSSDLEFED